MSAFTIVLLGGIASGKSTVSALLAERGAEVINADAIVHELHAEPEVQAALREAFGAEVIVDGALQTKVLAARVFADPSQRKVLEGILHPRVRARITERVASIGEAARGAPRRPVVVLDVPLAAEGGYAERADLTLFIACPEELRIARAVENRGWTAAELRAREQAQASLDEKRALAQDTIRNGHSKAEARDDVERVWKQFIEPRLEQG